MNSCAQSTPDARRERKELGLTVEPADREDANAILYLQRLAYLTEAELYGDWRIPPLTESLPQMLREFDRQLFLKAWLTDPRRVVGSVRVRRENGTAHIGRLIVHPDYHRRGIGTTLLREAEHRCASATRFELFTGHRSVRNLSFYEKQGYRRYGEEPVSDRIVLVHLAKVRSG